MIGDNGSKDQTDLDENDEEDLDVEEVSEDKMPDIGGDTMIDVSGELRVEELVANIEGSDPDEVAHRREVRRRLEELAEQRNKDLDSTFNFDLDEDS